MFDRRKFLALTSCAMNPNLHSGAGTNFLANWYTFPKDISSSIHILLVIQIRLSWSLSQLPQEEAETHRERTCSTESPQPDGGFKPGTFCCEAITVLSYFIRILLVFRLLVFWWSSVTNDSKDLRLVITLFVSSWKRGFLKKFTAPVTWKSFRNNCGHSLVFHGMLLQTMCFRVVSITWRLLHQHEYAHCMLTD